MRAKPDEKEKMTKKLLSNVDDKGSSLLYFAVASRQIEVTWAFPGNEGWEGEDEVEGASACKAWGMIEMFWLDRKYRCVAG